MLLIQYLKTPEFEPPRPGALKKALGNYFESELEYSQYNFEIQRNSQYNNVQKNFQLSDQQSIIDMEEIPSTFEILLNIEEQRLQRHEKNKRYFRSELLESIKNMKSNEVRVGERKYYTQLTKVGFRKVMGFYKIPIYKRVANDQWVNEVIEEFSENGYTFTWSQYSIHDTDYRLFVSI